MIFSFAPTLARQNFFGWPAWGQSPNFSKNASNVYVALAIDMETLDVIAKGTSQSIKEIMKEQLDKQRDPKKRLSTALRYLSTAAELEEQVGEIAAESWSYIQGNQLWEAGGYASLDALKEDIYFDHILKATIERSNTVADRKGKEILGDVLPQISTIC